MIQVKGYLHASSHGTNKERTEGVGQLDSHSVGMVMQMVVGANQQRFQRYMFVSQVPYLLRLCKVEFNKNTGSKVSERGNQEKLSV